VPFGYTQVPYFKRVPFEAIWTPQWTNRSWDARRKPEIINVRQRAAIQPGGVLSAAVPGFGHPEGHRDRLHGRPWRIAGRAGREAAAADRERQEAIVPLVMFGYSGPSIDTKYRANHQNLFPISFRHSLLRATATPQPFRRRPRQDAPKIQFD